MTQPPSGNRPVSEDGYYEWDGEKWIPRQQQAPPTGPPSPEMRPAPRKRRGRGKYVLGILLGLVVLLVVCTVALSGNNSASKPSATPAATTAAKTPAPAAAATAKPAAPAATVDPRGSCAPKPCQNDSYGWIVYVSGVTYDFKSDNPYDRPEAGNVFVKFDLRFENKTVNSHDANLSLFQLLDANGAVHHTTLGTVNCPYWSSVMVAPGGSYGPKCSVFEAAAGKAAPLTLIWTPSFGAYRIPLA